MWVAHAPGMPGTFSSPLQVSDADMHYGTCVTHVPRCMPVAVVCITCPGPLLLTRSNWNPAWVSNYSKSGQNETWGQHETPGVLKKHARRGSIFASTWFLSSASLAPCIEIKLEIAHILRIAQKRNFPLLINQLSHFCHQLLWQIKKYNRCIWLNTIMYLLIAFSYHLIEQRAIF